MGQYADLFARIVDAEQDMPELMAGEAEALTQVARLATEMSGEKYNVEIGVSHIAGPCLRVSDDKGDIAIIMFKIVPDVKGPVVVFHTGWGDGEARLNLATEEGRRRAAETIAQETLGQLHDTRRSTATLRHFDSI